VQAGVGDAVDHRLDRHLGVLEVVDAYLVAGIDRPLAGDDGQVDAPDLAALGIAVIGDSYEARVVAAGQAGRVDANRYDVLAQRRDSARSLVRRKPAILSRRAGGIDFRGGVIQRDGADVQDGVGDRSGVGGLADVGDRGDRRARSDTGLAAGHRLVQAGGQANGIDGRAVIGAAVVGLGALEADLVYRGSGRQRLVELVVADPGSVHIEVRALSGQVHVEGDRGPGVEGVESAGLVPVAHDGGGAVLTDLDVALLGELEPDVFVAQVARGGLLQVDVEAAAEVVRGRSHGVQPKGQRQDHALVLNERRIELAAQEDFAVLGPGFLPVHDQVLVAVVGRGVGGDIGIGGPAVIACPGVPAPANTVRRCDATDIVGRRRSRIALVNLEGGVGERRRFTADCDSQYGEYENTCCPMPLHVLLLHQGRIIAMRCGAARALMMRA